MALGPVTAFASLADLLAAFTADIQTGTSGGRWRFDPGGSTQTSSTGPGTNNGLDFVHTETSGSSLAGAEAAGLAEFATVPTETGRMLHLRLCIQGAFGDGTEGLEIQQRASADDAWAMVTLITGWLYSDSRIAGDTVADFAGEDQTVAASGGWVDFTVAIPDAATQVRLQPRYIQGEGSTWEHDIAFRSFQWEYADATGPSSLDAEATLTGGLTGSIVAAAALDTPSAAVTLDTIPRHDGEVVRIVITVGEASDDDTTPGEGKWWSRVDVDGVDGFGSIEGDPTIFDDAGTAGIQLDLDRVWWNGTDFRLNRDPLGTGSSVSEENFDGYFGSTTDLVLFVADADRSAEIAIIEANWRTIGGHFLNLTPGQDLRTFSEMTRAGNRVNLVIARAALASTSLDAAASLTGGLNGSIVAAAELSPLPLQAEAVLTGGLTGSIRAAAELVVGGPLNAQAVLTGGLTGAIRAAAALSGGTPLDARATLTGGLTGGITAAAVLLDAAQPISSMKLWLIALLLPWDELPERWATACAIAVAFDGMIAAGTMASHEWSPVTCRSTTLATWGETLKRPQRDSESINDYRVRLATWRSEPVGTSGWVREQVLRITGAERVIEFPREGFIGGYSSLPSRFGAGPVFAVGVAAAQRAALEAVLEPGVESTCGIQYIDPDVFDVIAADPP